MHNQIQEQIKDALRAKDNVRLTTLRGVLAAFTNESLVLKRTPKDKLSDGEAIAVIRRLVKQRKDSIEQFEKGGRKDLADNEKAELKVLEEFLPAQMSEEKIREIVNKILRQAQDDNSPILKNKGAFVGTVIKETKGEADGALVKKIVEEIFK
ncbi:MAG: hypothetical protein A3E02_02410 [Candidatus Zambryskibacteria bacterium RIFCSPHIGHO2_12_FULL_38_34]|uniref:Glutamyl-tRNA amidotransferase n=1 Tax=Candidatus Zambryskibacteria bacterium RIFCSPLOWO2_12_FULL_39_16 TaxID=1802775 RepID=A0A1G2URH3_9BACT|nr:MAG: hypothetical protein A3D37_00285 [Candidatus Zambryskibacteria bacterium RIFCSPHIGHO2_02_FULL_38_22]OHA97865.1 MAG: hypothetical protein A3E02_02410 [Candidatus Zambryskibacteria bacterium RIFCSPHIGHO2_12_FULL_38_34]OHB07856.1 MAG: hypothetical protein A3I19_02880 [Candidatus Zambryskibacteria bacterium RIFCSPLOWO2_02_FULL_38_13]OHB11950.1 MAG: hypothetical protein A3G46_01820 [Candidatus Zambryskibacteria bacterium RIFCSPLOWO2_12_FULL_39_16]